MNDMDLGTRVPHGQVLRVRVGPQTLAGSLQAFTRAAKAAQAGKRIEPQFSVGFSEIGPMLAVFTPRRWESIAALRSAGPSSVKALAQRPGRDYKNVHGDIAALLEWMVVQRLDDGRIEVP
ncbi:MAG: hypothetical protein QM750_00680 [Rubrivivax sp.]